MGTFGGHALPAVSLIIIGVQWIIAAWIEYFQSLNSERKKSYRSIAITGYTFYRLPKLPIDGFLIVLLTSIGFVVELISGLQANLQIDAQHMSMYFFYGIFGVVSILTFNRCPLPPFSDYAIFLLATSMTMLLFAFHTHGRNDLDKHVHTVLIIILAATIFITLNEMYHRTCATWFIARGIIFTLEGTWFLQIGFILYNPFTSGQTWDVDDHHAIMEATNIFSYHVAGNLLFAVLIGWLIWMRTQRNENGSRKLICEENAGLVLSVNNSGTT